MVRIVLVGVGGYGNTNMETLTEHIDPGLYRISGVVDPFAKDAPCYGRLMSDRIPIYSTLEEFYAHEKADLAIISTPIHLHKEHCLAALKNGSHVLCEKPLVPTLQDAECLRQAGNRSGKRLGIGFQWSFCSPILNLKKDILSGETGNPISLKSYVSFQRFDEYYNGWKGRVRDTAGNWILDSVSTNATSHYLHNIFFMMGDAPGSSQMPAQVYASVYRAKEIESFDTCFIEGNFDSNCRFLFIATHSGDEPHEPEFCYEFENCTVTMQGSEAQIISRFKDGRIKKYGTPQDIAANAEKIMAMIEVAQGVCEPTSGIDSILPHLRISNAIFDQVDIRDFSSDLRYRSENPQGSFVRGLSAQCDQCFKDGKTPYRMGFSWAVPDTRLELEAYTRFQGVKF